MKPPKRIPENLYNEFTLDGKMRVSYKYRDGTQKPLIHYSKDLVDLYIGKAKERVHGYYGRTDINLYDALDKYSIKDKNVVVMGSEKPMYESVSHVYGAKQVDVIEYNERTCDYDYFNYIRCENVDTRDTQYDYALSISSFEHDGLARYGDPIDPIGDFKAMSKMKDILKKDGILFLAVPIGRDQLVWNCHRIYGKIRFPLLIKEWELLDSFGLNERQFKKRKPAQPIFVLKNI